jgi:hypothetical protein
MRAAEARLAADMPAAEAADAAARAATEEEGIRARITWKRRGGTRVPSSESIIGLSVSWPDSLPRKKIGGQ